MDPEGLKGLGNHSCSLWKSSKLGRRGKGPGSVRQLTNQINHSISPGTEWGEDQNYTN